MRTQLTLVLRVVRAILASPALRQVEIAFLLFNAVEYGTWVAMLLYAYGATGPSSVGLVALIQLAPAAVVAPLSANLADRYRRDRVLLGGYLVQAMAFGLTAVAMAVGAPPVIVYVGAAAAATSLTTTRPTQGALLPSVSRTPEELTAANGLSGTVEARASCSARSPPPGSWHSRHRPPCTEPAQWPVWSRRRSWHGCPWQREPRRA